MKVYLSIFCCSAENEGFFLQKVKVYLFFVILQKAKVYLLFCCFSESESGQSGFKEFVEKTTQTILEMVATDLEDQLREEDGSQSASPQPNGSIPSLAGTTPSSQSSPLSSKEGLNVLGSKSGGSSESIEAGYQSDKSNRPFRRRRSAGKMSKRRKSGDSKAGDKELWQGEISEKVASDLGLGGGLPGTPVSSTTYNWLVTS